MTRFQKSIQDLQKVELWLSVMKRIPQEYLDDAEKYIVEAIRVMNEEEQYHKMNEKNRQKNSLCGDVVMTGEQLIEHNTFEHYEQQKKALRKVANNPILSADVKEQIWTAVYNIDAIITYRRWWRDELEIRMELEKRLSYG